MARIPKAGRGGDVMQDQPTPKGPSINIFAKPGRVAVTLTDGTYIGTVNYDVENPAHLQLLAAAFANAVAQTANRVQPAGPGALGRIKL